MENEDKVHSNRPEQVGFWKTRAGIILLTFLVIGGLLLVYEHRVHIFGGNGLLIGLLAACIIMHVFMHGGHGGHGGGENK